MGAHRKDPRQMSEVKKRMYEYRTTHRRMNLEALEDLESSMMLRLPVFLLDGPQTTGKIARDGEFCNNNGVAIKLRRLEEMGLITIDWQKRNSQASLTEEGRELALCLNTILKHLNDRGP